MNALPQVNGVPLCDAAERLDTAELRQRACSELLRQAAVGQGLLSADDALTADGVLSEAATQAIEALFKWRGATVGVAAAEAFMLGRQRA